MFIICVKVKIILALRSSLKILNVFSPSVITSSKQFFKFNRQNSTNILLCNTYIFEPLVKHIQHTFVIQFVKSVQNNIYRTLLPILAVCQKELQKWPLRGCCVDIDNVLRLNNKHTCISNKYKHGLPSVYHEEFHGFRGSTYFKSCVLKTAGVPVRKFNYSGHSTIQDGGQY